MGDGERRPLGHSLPSGSRASGRSGSRSSRRSGSRSSRRSESLPHRRSCVGTPTPPPSDPGWASVLAGAGLLAALALGLWVGANPLVGLAVLAALALLAVGVRRAYAVVACLRTCGALTVEVGRSVRVTVATARAPEES